MLMLSATTVLAAESLVVGDFSTPPEAGKLPETWQPLRFDGIDTHTQYTHVADEGRGVIKAVSRQGSSALVRKIEIDATQHPRLSFQWKIDGPIAAADLTRKKGDDAAARLYITFAYDADQVGWWEMVKFETIKLFYGEYPPIAALAYVWANRVEPGAILDNAYTGRVKMIVLESGGSKKGERVTEQRNVVADYRKAFATETVPVISGVGIMTDTDNTGGQAVAWYGDIIFSE